MSTKSTATEPLDAEEMQAWAAFIQVATKALDVLDRELQAHHGLSLADYEILSQLSSVPDRRLQMTELAGVSMLSQSRLTYRVDRLERDGLVQRVPCESDGRRIWAQLTPAGFSRLEEAYPVHLDGVRRYIVDPPQRRDLIAAGRALQAMLGAIEPAG